MLQNRDNSSWWKWFWITIFILLLVYIVTVFMASNKKLELKNSRENHLQEMITTLRKISPDLEKYIVNMSDVSKKRIEERIDKDVTKAYESVYTKGIDNFSDFHYSVKGEYIELFAQAEDGSRSYLKLEEKDKFDKLVYEMLFKSTGFDANLKKAYKDINSFALSEMSKNIENLHKKVQNDLNVSDDEADLLIEQIFKSSVSDMKERFSDTFSKSFRATGVGGGAITGVLVSKQIAKVFAKKLATKLAVKGGSKVAGSVAGAAAGGETGLLCGPAAVFCSPVGAVIGGVVGWFATDAIVATVDEYYNADDFKNELRGIIKAQEMKTKKQLYSVYTMSINEINAENKKKLEEFKNRQNREQF
jgi:hypothetical protein